MPASRERLIIEKMFRVADKDGQDVDFLLNSEQAELDSNLSGRDVIAKARQMGFSTYVLALFLARCLMYRNRRAVLVSHDTQSTQKLLARIHYMIKHMKGAKPDLKYANQNYITFNKTDSSIYVGTAGAGDFGVGDTISDLHCSEVSRWENPGPLLSGLFQAVPTSGTIILESTGRGTGNYFHRLVMNAKEGSDEGFKLHFFNWLLRPEYSLPTTPEQEQEVLANLDEETEEKYYLETYGLTVGQLRWRRRKIAELDHDLQQFKEQYPCSLDECFQSSGSGFFQKVSYKKVTEWQQVDAHTHALTSHPIRDHFYCAGVDPAGGLGLDNSVMEIFDVESGEQVLELVTKTLTPTQFAIKCAEILQPYAAYTNFERNNHGFEFGAKFIQVYDKKLIHRTHRRVTKQQLTEMQKISDWGQVTSEISKPLIIGKFRTALLLGNVTLHSEALKMECHSFVETASGKIEATKGCKDDRVMAASLAIEVRIKAASVGSQAKGAQERRRGKTTAEAFQAGVLINELERRYGRESQGGGPIKTGVLVE